MAANVIWHVFILILIKDVVIGHMYGTQYPRIFYNPFRKSKSGLEVDISRLNHSFCYPPFLLTPKERLGPPI